MTNQKLSPTQSAQARANSYDLFSQLFLHGLTAETLPIVQMIPELAATLPDTLDLDRAAAEHQRLFGLNLFPFQSIFLDPSGLVGGDEADRVAAAYAECGFVPLATGEGIDHIGQQLACLAFLCAAEAEALEDGKAAIALRIQRLQQNVLNQHLLRWLPPLVCTLQRQDNPLFAAIADLLIGLVDIHLAGLEAYSPFTITGSPFTLPTPPDLLTKDDTTLHDIAIYFLRPAWCGLDLTRSELTQMGRQLQIPSGFAERETQFVNLLRTASQYDHFAALLSKLAERIEHDKRYYQEFPFLSRSVHASAALWMQRLEKSEQLVEELKKMAITQQTAAEHGAQAAS